MGIINDKGKVSALGEKRGTFMNGASALTIDDNRFPRQGEYTASDFYQLVDENERAELIDGVIYLMASPIPAHQMIAQLLWRSIQDYIDARKGSCQAFGVPLDVQLDADDDRNILSPDVMIICDPDKTAGSRVIGAPDFIAEILSPSTRMRDMTTKLWKYEQAGVKEYWIIDPKKLKVIVYEFAPEYDVTTYSFHDLIPVRIYDGDLEIDFQTIYQRIQGMYGVG